MGVRCIGTLYSQFFCKSKTVVKLRVYCFLILDLYDGNYIPYHYLSL